MSDIARSIFAGTVVVLGIGAIVAGLVVRDHQDLGSFNNPTVVSVGGLVASRDGAEVPADRFFAQMVEKLKREYVDVIDDDQKLASGSVRGMINSLNDPNSVFMDPKEFLAYNQSLSGHYEGVGVELSLEDSKPPAQSSSKLSTDKDQALTGTVVIPKLTVVGLTPQGPAAKAGVQIGDTVEFVDGRWLIQAEPIQALRVLASEVERKKAPMSALIKMRKDLRAKLEKSVLPLRAKDELTLGDSGTLNVVWQRSGKELSTVLKREKSEFPTIETAGAYRLSFGPDALAGLEQAVKGSAPLVLDLRNDPVGDFSVMKKCLALVAPKGDYGLLESQKEGKSKPLTLSVGNGQPPKLTLLVDRSTRGVAEIFALALQSKGLATLQGGPMAGYRLVSETVALPDGSGYSLVTSKYRPPLDKSIKGKAVAVPVPKSVAETSSDEVSA